MQLYNTLTRKKEEFKPIGDFVKFYSCGPTVYNFAHIGNFRAYIVADLLKRALMMNGFKVEHVMNLTDVDDKTIRDSKAEGVSLKEFTERYTKYFFEDMAALNVLDANLYPKATMHVNEMISMTQQLLDSGIAYKTDDGIYFSVSKFENYGDLAGIDISSLKEGASTRVLKDEYDKESANDFALWKFYSENDGDVVWDAPFGRGRPGWHIECSAMSTKYLGEHIDIHSGGIDLIFPHHTNEIAQSEACFHTKFVNYWVHNEHLLVDGKKMAKSFKNFYTLRDILEKGYNPLAVRLLLISTHYRQPLNFTFELLEKAERDVISFTDFYMSLRELNESGKFGSDDIVFGLKEKDDDFSEAIADDLNVSRALAAVYELMNLVNKSSPDEGSARLALELFLKFDSIFRFIDYDIKQLTEEEKELVAKRDKAREEKDWKTADALRDELKEKGIELRDTKEGTIARKR